MDMQLVKTNQVLIGLHYKFGAGEASKMHVNTVNCLITMLEFVYNWHDTWAVLACLAKGLDLQHTKKRLEETCNLSFYKLTCLWVHLKQCCSLEDLQVTYWKAGGSSLGPIYQNIKYHLVCMRFQWIKYPFVCLLILQLCFCWYFRINIFISALFQCHKCQKCRQIHTNTVKP